MVRQLLFIGFVCWLLFICGALVLQEHRHGKKKGKKKGAGMTATAVVQAAGMTARIASSPLTNWLPAGTVPPPGHLD